MRISFKNVILHSKESMVTGTKLAWDRLPIKKILETEGKGELRKCLKPSG
jgi:hypothetical protein